VRIALLLVLAACGSTKSPGPCERGAKVELRLVDHDAAYMKQAFAKVNPELKTGASQDPDAIAAGVRADIDMWRRDTDENEPPGEQQVDYFLLAADRAALVGYLAKLKKPPDDRELRIERTDAGFRTYYVFTQPILETKHIADVRAADQVVLELTAEGRTRFATATADAAKASRKIATLLDGEVQSAPIINSAIRGGRFMIRAPDPAALAKRLACVTASSR
jgi:preprotein translocase subunit SecD